MYSVKVIVIGDSGVGKTNLITRFCQNHFKDTYVATIGVDFKIKTLPIGDKTFKLQIWDTAGQERFKNITQTYYKGAAGIILAYSITDSLSFSNIQRWIQQIDNNCTEEVSKVLVATKSDLESERTISTEDGKKLAERYSIPFLEVSAKSGNLVKEAFEILGRQIVKKQEQKGVVPGFESRKNVLRAAGETPKKRCIC